ncbi:MAG: diguanylate cyclase [Gammaproteobacteria bacterium]|nr:diguanylate cyclase [Gammaproteobacteria bacterium]MBT3490057.1 diguanylate cyclase [Gammaproteobacteria bacterium]MBT3719479.1 diguanylate cyclase [Gammaproteobacteria bacterium]MBT4301161.1 diguanylate cyclase [Gammaproteobacteria bacterium]MBT4549594.1 diguanylate cyclase [Gammaproteobacteria bacterium]
MKIKLLDANVTLLAGFGLVLLLMAAQMTLSISELYSLRDRMDKIVTDKLVKSSLAQKMFDASRERALLLMMVYYEGDPFERDELVMQFRGYAERFMSAREKLYEKELSLRERTVLGESVSLAADGALAMNQVLDMILDEQNKLDHHEFLLLFREQVFPIRNQLTNKMEEIGWTAVEESQKALDIAEENFQHVQKLLWLLGGAALLISIVIVWMVYKRIPRTSSKLHYMYEEMDHIAKHDELTGLLNRQTFEGCLEEALKRAAYYQELLAVLYIDLDGLKKINDRYGRSLGDLVLQRVSRQFMSYVRDADSIARVGGDEFVIILSKVGSKENVVEVTERILKGLEAEIELGNNRQTQIGASIGVALYPEDGESEEQLLSLVDQAVGEAKRRGGHQFHFAEEDTSESQ